MLVLHFFGVVVGAIIFGYAVSICSYFDKYDINQLHRWQLVWLFGILLGVLIFFTEGSVIALHCCLSEKHLNTIYILGMIVNAVFLILLVLSFVLLAFCRPQLSGSLAKALYVNRDEISWRRIGSGSDCCPKSRSFFNISTYETYDELEMHFEDFDSSGRLKCCARSILLEKMIPLWLLACCTLIILACTCACCTFCSGKKDPGENKKKGKKFMKVIDPPNPPLLGENNIKPEIGAGRLFGKF